MLDFKFRCNTFASSIFQRNTYVLDIFDRIRGNRGPLGQHAKDTHGYFTFPKLEGDISNRMMFRGKEVLVWSINNYLGLANHPEVRAVDAEASKEWGMGYPMGARMMSGQTKYHEELEQKLVVIEDEEEDAEPEPEVELTLEDKENEMRRLASLAASVDACSESWLTFRFLGVSCYEIKGTLMGEANARRDAEKLQAVLLRLLIAWLHGCAPAVNSFLAPAAHLRYHAISQQRSGSLQAQTRDERSRFISGLVTAYGKDYYEE